jgi:hypothetical protein
MNRVLYFLLVLLALHPAICLAKDNTGITIFWPSDKEPTLRLVFGDFQRVAVLSGQGLYTCDVTVQNVTNKVMPPSVFTVYVTDKNHLRIADSFCAFLKFTRSTRPGRNSSSLLLGRPQGSASLEAE